MFNGYAIKSEYYGSFQGKDYTYVSAENQSDDEFYLKLLHNNSINIPYSSIIDFLVDIDSGKREGDVSFYFNGSGQYLNFYKLFVIIDGTSYGDPYDLDGLVWTERIPIKNERTSVELRIVQDGRSELPFPDIYIHDIKLRNANIVRPSQCPIRITDNTNSEEINKSLKNHCNTIQLAGGVNLQKLVNIIEDLQKIGFANEVTLLLEGAYYEGNLDIHAKNLTIKSISIQKPVIDGNNGDGNIFLNNTSNIKLYNLNLINSEEGLCLRNSKNCVVSDNNLHFLNEKEAGIYLCGGSNNNTIKNNLIFTPNVKSLSIASNKSIDNTIYIKNNGMSMIEEDGTFYCISDYSFSKYDEVARTCSTEKIKCELKKNNNWWVCQ